MSDAAAPAGSHRGEVALIAILAIQVTTIFVVAPLAAIAEVPYQAVEWLRLGLAAITILIVARSRITRGIIAAASLATVAAGLQWRLGAPGAVVITGKILVTIVFDMVVAFMVALLVFREGRVTVHRILGAVILYLYVALVFAGLYGIAAVSLHPSFTGLQAVTRARFADLLYFSLGSLTTGGTGDLVAVHPLVRSLASLESVIGQLFPATLLARLVTLHAAGDR